MAPDVPTADSEEGNHDASHLQRQDSVLDTSSTEIDESDATSTTQTHKSWTMDDGEGLVLHVLDEIVSTSTQQAMGNFMNRQLFGYLAAWSVAIIQECLDSAIAPSGDAGVDEDDCNTVKTPERLLGCVETTLEALKPPKRCSLDYSYQRGQMPIKAGRLDSYDSESLHHAVRAVTRSHSHPASVASSRLTTKSRIRRKKHDTTAGHAVSTGPQPGVPFSTEGPQSNRPYSRHHIVSPRKVISMRNTSTAGGSNDPTLEPCELGTNPPVDLHINEIAVTGLQLNIDTEILHVAATQTPQSPPPLSRSPLSIASSRRRPHPPGSAQNGHGDTTISFGEKADEVQVEYAVLKSSPGRSSTKSRSVLPNLDSGRITPRLKVSNTAFRILSDSVDASGGEREKDTLFNVDQLDQTFHKMPLSPGVKLRAGEESNTGPDLPSFAARMRRSTFIRMETCSLPTAATNSMPSLKLIPSEQQNQHQVQQLGKATFLTEPAWDLDSSTTGRASEQEHVKASPRGKNPTGNTWGSRKSEAFSLAAPIDSCLCDSSGSLTLFRKQGKVERPCRNCRGSKPDSSCKDPMDFTNLVKQRAFHQKPPSLPTSSSPSKRAPGTSPRRVTSAPACSPLARRNLLFSKKTPQPHNRGVESATSVL